MPVKAYRRCGSGESCFEDKRASERIRTGDAAGEWDMITGVHHFSIIASSEESVGFYEKLGFRENKRIERTYDTVVLMSGYGIGLEVFIDPSHPGRSSG